MAPNVRYAFTQVKRECELAARVVERPICKTGRVAKNLTIRPHLRAWRLHLGQTLETVADALGTSHTTVIRWESGRHGVNDDTFAAIARHYGISPAELSAAPADAPKARQMARLLETMPKLTTEALATLADMAEHLRKR